MNIIIYPCEEVINTYLSIGYSVEMYISYDGETVIVCNSDTEKPSQTFLADKGYDHINFNEFYRILLSRDDARWDFNCPTNYKQITNNQKRQQSFYIDGLAKISTVLANLNCFITIRISKSSLSKQDCMLNFNVN